MRLAAWLLAALAFALGAASPAWASWKRQVVAKKALAIESVTIAGNDRGDAALAYAGRAGVYLAVAAPGQGFGRPRAVPGSNTGSSNPEQVAVDEHGNVVVGWTYNDGSQPERPFQRDEGCCRRIRVALLRHGSKRFAVSKTMGQPGRDSRFRALAVVNGRVGVAWDDFDGTSAKFGRRGVKLGAAVRVAGADALAAMPLRTGPVFTFARAHYGADGIPDWSIRELRVTRGTTRLLFSRQSAFSFLTVASNARGEQVVAWLEGTPAGGNDLYAGFRKAGTVFRARRLSGARFDPPSIALASTGAAAVAWERGYGTLIYAAGRPPGGAFGGVGLISSRSLDDFVYNPWVAVAPSGRALVAWEGFSRRGGYHQRAAFRSRGGWRVGIQDLGRTNSYARLNSVALDSHGNGRVVWSNALDVIAALGSLPRR